MKTYCEGTHCKKRDTCAKHHMAPDEWYEYIDLSKHGGGRYWQDSEGNNYCETWFDCSDEGNYKLYEEAN